uniref:KH type-2 domain-containing protein n=1 Tax=Microcebus murinus TaxID=30608 RepID=A0A8C5YFS6_MICMU
MVVQISKKRKSVADGIFKLAEDGGYSEVEVRVTPTRTEIIIFVTRAQNVLGEKSQHIWELTTVVQKRFGFPEEDLLWCAAVHHGECRGVWETPRTEG